ncbi:MAG TPA: dihydropteroate synthase [Terriglobia bacterium]|nr:dihydropteroate synthase [Terriglobia bacterium]
MLIIGELINCTRKKVGEAAQNRDVEFFQDIARKQVEAGADMLDVNGGLPGQEVEVLPWLVKIVQEAVETPLCLDSADPASLGRALPLCKQRAMINSITDEPARLQALLPLLKEFRPQLIALCLGESGPPHGVDDRVATASRLIDRLTAEGHSLDDIYVDPCVLPISTDSEQGKALAEATRLIVARYPGVHASAGISNVSFGLPSRKLLNDVLIVLLMAQGLDAAIVNPCDQQLMMNVRAAEALLSRDEFCAKYLRAFREGKLGQAA